MYSQRLRDVDALCMAGHTVYSQRWGTQALRIWGGGTQCIRKGQDTGAPRTSEEGGTLTRCTPRDLGTQALCVGRDAPTPQSRELATHTQPSPRSQDLGYWGQRFAEAPRTRTRKKLRVSGRLTDIETLKEGEGWGGYTTSRGVTPRVPEGDIWTHNSQRRLIWTHIYRNWSTSPGTHSHVEKKK